MKISDVGFSDMPDNLFLEDGERNIEIEDKINKQIIALTLIANRLEKRINHLELTLNHDEV